MYMYSKGLNHYDLCRAILYNMYHTIFCAAEVNMQVMVQEIFVEISYCSIFKIFVKNLMLFSKVLVPLVLCLHVFMALLAICHTSQLSWQFLRVLRLLLHFQKCQVGSSCMKNKMVTLGHYIAISVKIFNICHLSNIIYIFFKKVCQKNTTKFFFNFRNKCQENYIYMQFEW